MRVKDIMARCEELYFDPGFSYVKAYKEKHRVLAIGHLPVYVPRELIHAAGLLPVGLLGNGEIEIIRGDSYFQSYICHLPRSVIEQGLNGGLDPLDGFLFPAICDVVRNLSGMWKILFPGKYVKYLELPHNFREEIGGEFYQRELQGLAADLSRLGGGPVTTDALNRSIGLYNENRRALRELYARRTEHPHQVPTPEVYLLLRAANLLEVREHTALVEDYLAAVGEERRPPRDNVRVVLTGAFCEQPPLALIRAMENSGCQIVGDDWVLGPRFLLEDVPRGDEPLQALSDAYLKHTVRTASKYEEDGDKGAFLVSQVKSLRAAGVIFAAPSFCDPALLERPLQQEALVREGIPHTAFQYAENTGQFQAIKEQLGTFSDSLKLWGE